MTRASVIIPSHGRADSLEAIVAPLLSDPATAELIVVADRDEATAATARGIGDDRVRVLEADFGHEAFSRQLGLANAQEDVVVVLDDDVLASPGLVTGHLRHHHQAGRVVLGHMPVSEHRRSGVWNFAARLYAQSYDDQVAVWRSRPDVILTKFWAGNFSMRREDALAVGISNPGYRGLFYIDHEFGERLMAAGLTGVFDPSLEAEHLFERTADQWRRDARRQGAVHALHGRSPREGASAHFTSEPARRIADAALRALAAAAAGAGAYRVERRLIWMLLGVEMHVGAREVRSGDPVGAGLLAPVRDQARQGAFSDAQPH